MASSLVPGGGEMSGRVKSEVGGEIRAEQNNLPPPTHASIQCRFARRVRARAGESRWWAAVVGGYAAGWAVLHGSRGTHAPSAHCEHPQPGSEERIGVARVPQMGSADANEQVKIRLIRGEFGLLIGRHVRDIQSSRGNVARSGLRKTISTDKRKHHHAADAPRLSAAPLFAASSSEQSTGAPARRLFDSSRIGVPSARTISAARTTSVPMLCATKDILGGFPFRYGGVSPAAHPQV